MKQFNQKFRSRTHHLVLQIIEDKAEQKPYQLLDALFDKEYHGSLDNYPNFKQDWLFPYFAEAKKASGEPFAGLDNQLEQIAFLNQLKTQIRRVTYNFKNLEYIFPKELKSTDSASGQPDYQYSAMEKNLVLIGLVLPVLHSFEQKTVDNLSVVDGKATTSSEQSNPYQSLDQQLLVQGLSGEFDKTVSYGDLQKLYTAVQGMRANGVSEDKITQFLRTELGNKGIRTTENGQIIPLLSGLQSSETAEDLDESLSIEQAFALLDQRLGLKIQQSIVISSKGNLSLPAFDINFFKNNGEVLSLNGVDVFFDASGRLSSENLPGNNFVMFFRDQNGDMAMVSGNKQAYRNENQTDYDFLISLNTNQIHENDAGFALAEQDLNQTELPLQVLLKQKSQTGQYSPENPPQALIIPKPSTSNPPSNAASNKGAPLEHELEGEVTLPVQKTGVSSIPVKFKPLSGPFVTSPVPSQTQQTKIIQKTKVILPPSGSKIQQPMAKSSQPQTTPTGGQPAQNQPINQPRRTQRTVAQQPSPQKTPNFMLRSLITQGAAVSGILGSVITFLS
jgi:hypothetical protein